MSPPTGKGERSSSSRTAASRAYLECLSSEERTRIERSAISAATEGEKTVLQSLTNTEGPAYQAALGRMVTRYLPSSYQSGVVAPATYWQATPPLPRAHDRIQAEG